MGAVDCQNHLLNQKLFCISERSFTLAVADLRLFQKRVKATVAPVQPKLEASLKRTVRAITAELQPPLL